MGVALGVAVPVGSSMAVNGQVTGTEVALTAGLAAGALGAVRTLSWYCERLVGEISWKPAARRTLTISTLTMVRPAPVLGILASCANSRSYPGCAVGPTARPRRLRRRAAQTRLPRSSCSGLHCAAPIRTTPERPESHCRPNNVPSLQQ